MSLFAPLSRRALEELLEPRLPACQREPSVVLLCWCGYCGEWMREGSAEAGRCVDCGTWRNTEPAQGAIDQATNRDSP
jgi:hypothetical protein